jgi:AraC-like DNA-binding protein
MIDLVLRLGAITLLLLWAALAWTGARRQRLYGLACLCAGLYLVVKSPVLSSSLGPALGPLQAIAATGPLWFLIATRRAFGACAGLSALHLGALAAALASLAWAAHMYRAHWYVMVDLILLALFGAALHAAWQGLKDELDPGRRAHRIFLLNASAALGVLVSMAALATRFSWAAPISRIPIETAIAGGVFAAALALCAVTLRVQDFEVRARPARADASPLANRILTALTHDRLYRDPQLTISRLAYVLEAPEHQVRATINAELGHKNFSEFVNSFRLAEVKVALSDPAQAQTPISTIALDAGFGSIASFNRVFRAAFGASPSAFRRAASS